MVPRLNAATGRTQEVVLVTDILLSSREPSSALAVGAAAGSARPISNAAVTPVNAGEFLLTALPKAWERNSTSLSHILSPGRSLDSVLW